MSLANGNLKQQQNVKEKREEEEVQMGWQSYVVPIVGSAFLSTFTYFLGKWDYSFLWILLIVIISVTKSYLWRKRERRLMSLRSTALREREVILAQLQDLPAWVQFPDTERVEWINKVVHQLWPYIGEYARTFMNDFIIPQVKAQMPGIFKNFKFTKMDMGVLRVLSRFTRASTTYQNSMILLIAEQPVQHLEFFGMGGKSKKINRNTASSFGFACECCAQTGGIVQQSSAENAN
ncbi:unnamed protein product [Caenorhabditis angaria]|uniref:Synaptotagmin SMP domain-containing protein n=1 Tax=Caenorhabditis angaria TaxID=860376 RepID=A0A9P1IJG2_9PELO|nr:unnamed protein product [Caenorhabditis angaria]